MQLTLAFSSNTTPC